jgi:hypothetical protein
MNILKTLLLINVLLIHNTFLAESWIFEENKEKDLTRYSSFISKDIEKEYISFFCDTEDSNTLFLFSSVSKKSNNEIDSVNIYFDDLSEFYLKGYYTEKTIYFSEDSFNSNDINDNYNFNELYNKFKYNNYLVLEIIDNNNEIEKYTFDLNNSKNTLNTLSNNCS